MSVAVEDMRVMSDEELLGLYTAGEQAALTEAARRDQATADAARIAPARQALEAIRGEWRDAAYADYLAAGASMICKSTMFSPEGLRHGPADEFSLWTVRESDARRWASSELCEWWDLHGRLTAGEFAKRRAAAMRAAREDTSTEEAGHGNRMDADGRDGLDADAARGVRRDSGPGAVRDTGNEAVTQEGAGSRDGAGPVQRGDKPVSIADGVRVAGHLAAGAARAEERLDQARQQAGIARTVAVPGGQAAMRPSGRPIDGAWLANLADAWAGKHCHLTDAARHAIALWVMAQHFRKPGESPTMIWEKFPHLLFIAETPGSGKTTTMKVAGFMCAPFYFGTAANPTAPGLCYTIAQENAVVCIDEGHRIIGPKGTRKADVVTIICASFEQDGTYLNGRGGKANRVPVYSPMMIAAKKDPFLTSAGEEIADVIERSHLILMSKPPEGTDLAPVTAETRDQGKLIGEKMAQWAAQRMADKAAFKAAAEDARAVLAEIGLKGRDADVWLAQFTVAALCSPGHLQAACDAALELRRNQPAPKEEDEADPLADLEASLAGAGEIASWG